MIQWPWQTWKRRFRAFFQDRLYVRAFLGEFISTYAIIAFINGMIAQAVLTDGEKSPGVAPSWGAAVASMTGIWIAIGVSGAHSNPAFSLLFTLRGFITWRQLPIYWLGQYLGAIAGAASALGVYWEALMDKTGGQLSITNTDPGLAMIFATYPAPYVSVLGAIPEQIAISSLMALCVTAMTDQKNMKVPFTMLSIYLGFMILALSLGFSMNSGGSPNPARDLGPRIVSYFAGWGLPVFSFRNWTWFWVPVLMPHIGVIIGYAIYFVFIEAHWPIENGNPN